MGMGRGDQITAVIWDDDIDIDLGSGQSLIQARQQLRDPLAGVG